ncbi:MAG: fumarate hydratase [archaeon]
MTLMIMKKKSRSGHASLLPEQIIELYRLAATELPKDIEAGLRKALKSELSGTLAESAIAQILQNSDISKCESVSLCQDTGTPIFYVSCPAGFSHTAIRKAILAATKKATKEIPLRSNAVDTLSGKNTLDNTGEAFPVIHFEEWNKTYLKVDLLLKGGGSENIGRTYSLPDIELNADRSIEGVRKCILDAVFRAQGMGCPPEVIGVAVGGSREVVSELSMRQLLRRIDDKNPNPRLDKFEKRMLQEANSLCIGPSGFGGNTTALAVKVAFTARHVASYFVDVSFGCWALRRKTLVLKGGKAKYA